MSAAKPFSDAPPQSHVQLPRRIERRAIPRRHAGDAEPCTFQDDRRPARSATTPSAASRFLFQAAIWLCGSTGDVFSRGLPSVLSWVVAEVLAGCSAYALAMHPVPVVDGHSDSAAPAAGDLASPGKPRVDRRPSLRVILGSGPDAVDADRPGWRVVPAGLAVLLRAKLRRARASRQAVAELQSLDDLSLRDIGLSRGDIRHLARQGAQME